MVILNLNLNLDENSYHFLFVFICIYFPLTYVLIPLQKFFAYNTFLLAYKNSLLLRAFGTDKLHSANNSI